MLGREVELTIKLPWQALSLTTLSAPLRPGPLSLLLPYQVSSPHLARSYHHLFPVPQFEETSAAAVAAAAAAAAGPGNGAIALGAGAGRQGKQGAIAAAAARGAAQGRGSGAARASCAGCLRDLSGLARYRCPECSGSFCLDCDMYVHDSLHNCPGCC